MATVTKRRRKVGERPGGKPLYKDEGFQVRYVDPDGVERRKVFRLKGEADRFAVEVEHRKLSGLYVDPAAGRMTFREYAEAWRVVQAHRSGTAEVLESRLRLHVYPLIGHRPLAAIRPTELQALVRDRAAVMAPATLENVFAWVRTIFRAAIDDRIITTSPASRVKLPDDGDPAREVVVLESTIVDALADGIVDRLSAAVEVGASAGLRSGEVLGLTVDRVDFLRRTITVDRQLLTRTGHGPCFGPPKTKASKRVIPIGDVLVRALAAHLAAFPPTPGVLLDDKGRKVEHAGLIFTNDQGEPWRRQRWAAAWVKAVAAVGLPKGSRFHALRHTYASALIAAGCSVKVVQARLGHANAQETLDTYSHLWPDDEDRTRAAVDRFRSSSEDVDLEHDATRRASIDNGGDLVRSGPIGGNGVVRTERMERADLPSKAAGQA